MAKKRIKYKLYNSFPLKRTALTSANNLRKSGYRVTVKRLKPAQAGGRLKWGVYTGGRRKK